VLELFVSPGCPFCAELRERLDWEGDDYVELNVASDLGALGRLRELAGPNPIVPVLVEDGRVKEIGWQGRGCYVGGE
jgi:mycoredoxin